MEWGGGRNSVISCGPPAWRNDIHMQNLGKFTSQLRERKHKGGDKPQDNTNTHNKQLNDKPVDVMPDEGNTHSKTTGKKQTKW